MHLPQAISKDIIAYFKSHTEVSDDDYACVYGSSVYEGLESRSDIDMFVVTHGKNISLDGLIAFISRLHAKHGRNVDVEVPYENKIHYTAEEIDAAAHYAGFGVTETGISIPAIKKDLEFLSSPAIKARLALNALTTPHVVYGVNLRSYDQARENAEDAITLLGADLTASESMTFTLEDLHRNLVADKNGDSGEDFLGYKTEYPVVAEYLYNLLDRATVRLACNGMLRRRGSRLRLAGNVHPFNYMLAKSSNAHNVNGRI